MARPHLWTALLLLAIGPVAAYAQTAAPAAAAAATDRVLGTVAATADGTVTVHPASGPDVVITLGTGTRMLRTAPGATTLAGATPIQASDLSVGDRVLVRFAPGSDPQHPTAAVLIAMKSADIAQTHAAQSADWQQHGVSGVVESVDAGANLIHLKARASAPALTIHVTPSTVFRRYAPTSTSFADAVPSALSAIAPGDQLRARGSRTGNDVTADEIVAGSFQNIAGTVVHTDDATHTLVLHNLATKKDIALQVDAQTQLRKLPPFLAQRLARQTGDKTGDKTSDKTGDKAGSNSHAPGSMEAAGSPEGAPAGRGQSTEAILERAPALALSDLKKGDAVMVVASDPSAPQVTALTVIAGVEPILQGSGQGSSELFNASWNIGGGGGGGGEEAGGEGGAPQR